MPIAHRDQAVSFRRRPACCFTYGLSIVVAWAAVALSEPFPTPKMSDIHPSGIRGSLVICGGGQIPSEAIDWFLDFAGGDEASLVVIPTAAERADSADLASFATPWKERGFPRVEVIHTRNRAVADSEDFVAPIKSATAVWFVGGQQSRLAKAYVGTRVERELSALIERGGIIGGTSAGAAIQSRLMIAFGNPEATVMRGLDLLPGAVIDQHFKARNRQPRLKAVLAEHPGYYGLGIDEDTAMLVQGRTIRVVGESTVTVCFSESAIRAAKQYEIASGERIDLTALRRAAIARAGSAFPPESLDTPCVRSGSLVIVGGRATDEIRREFVRLAGDSNAKIVIVPTASENPKGQDNRTTREFMAAGAKTVSILHTTDRTRANSLEFLEPLQDASGVWFTGGRQWRLVDAYEGTCTCDAFWDVLRRGGVIGGSSAGATIQGEYLVRGSPLGNREMMAEGYERGFGFLPGCAIDQHFTQRHRQADMERLKRTFPQLLGIGIDESTALIVRQCTARVMGRGSVYFYGAKPSDRDGQTEFTKVSAGQDYDLQQRMLTDMASPQHSATGETSARSSPK